MASQRGIVGPIVRNHAPAQGNGELLADDLTDGEGKGDASPQRKRRRRPPITEKGKARNVKVPHSVWRRLELDSMNRGLDKSKRLVQILDAALPFFELLQKERPPAAE
jgi:hypothetical protein